MNLASLEDTHTCPRCIDHKSDKHYSPYTAVLHFNICTKVDTYNTIVPHSPLSPFYYLPLLQRNFAILPLDYY
jgi:hypothetical protein